MIGWTVYGQKVEEINFQESDIRIIFDDIEYLIVGSYIHNLFRNKVDAYKQLKSELIFQKEVIENKLKEVEMEIENVY